VTETQIFYNVTNDGMFFWCQVIHSSIGVWYPTIQFTCKVYNPKTGEKIWKSVNVSNFVTPPPGLDKRSSKADEFSITYNPSSSSKASSSNYTYPESYTIRCNLGTDLQLSLNVNRVSTAPGFKVGSGPQGGYSYFGPSTEKPDGYVIHRFWPLTHFDGHIIKSGQADSVTGKGMMIHAIQGMRPNLVASSWNFGWFTTQKLDGTSTTEDEDMVAIQMEFKTIDSYGLKGAGSGGVSVSVGCLVVDGKLATVVGETKVPGEEQAEDSLVQCRVKHVEPHPDSETGYNIPSQVLYKWSGPPIPGSGGKIGAETVVPFGKDATKLEGLVEKVDVLAEIPYVVKMAVNYVAGTKPYIYQSINPGTLKITGDNEREVKGTIYNESTFIS
jgi:hypothetical protein